MTVNLLTVHVADTVERRVASGKSKTAFFSGKLLTTIERALIEGMGTPDSNQTEAQHA